MSTTDWWPSDYFTSRDRFVERARAHGARVRSCPVAAAGPAGEALSVDIAELGDEQPDHLIVLTSGLHGVEGFLGASIQVQALHRLACRGIPSGVGIVMVHAVNPSGFAHLRRVDENNVDVNRNFIDPGETRPTTPVGYAELDPLINPRSAPTSLGELTFWLKATRVIARERGFAPLAKPIAEGQSAFPQGLFYGGEEIGASAHLLQNVLLELSANAGRITHLDVHSGLGTHAVATLIGNTNSRSREHHVDRLSVHYGQAMVLDDAAGNAYNAQGTLAHWYRRTLQDKPYLYLCVEIGTVHPLRVLTALKRENQAHHWTPAGSRPYVDTKQALLDVFAPHSHRWRRESTAQGLHTLDRTLALS